MPLLPCMGRIELLFAPARRPWKAAGVEIETRLLLFHFPLTEIDGRETVVSILPRGAAAERPKPPTAAFRHGKKWTNHEDQSGSIRTPNLMVAEAPGVRVPTLNWKAPVAPLAGLVGTAATVLTPLTEAVPSAPTS